MKLKKKIEREWERESREKSGRENLKKRIREYKRLFTKWGRRFIRK